MHLLQKQKDRQGETNTRKLVRKSVERAVSKRYGPFLYKTLYKYNYGLYNEEKMFLREDIRMFAKRIRNLRKESDFTQAQLAKDIGVTQQAVAKWETGRAVPDTAVLVRLCARLGTSVDYLLGTGEQHIGEVLPFAATVQVPILGSVRAGYDSPAYEDYQGMEPAHVRNPEQHCYLIVQGDSMEPFIHDGDLALVHKQPTLNDGDVGVVIYGGGEATLKRFRRRDKKVVLEPFNEAYEALVIEADEMDRLYVFGKVMETKTRW